VVVAGVRFSGKKKKERKRRSCFAKRDVKERDP